MQSNPSIAGREVVKPIMTEVPMLLQPPSLLNSVKTAAAELRGAKIHSGMIMRKTPTTCRRSTNDSTKGSFFAARVLKKTANTVIAIIKRVACQSSGIYVLLFRMIRP